jgi:hypothetical protein
MNTLTRILKAVLVTLSGLVIVIALLLIALAYAAPYIPIYVASFGFYLTKPVTREIVSATGMDIWIARALALIFYAVVMFSLSALLKKLSPPHILFNKRGRILLFSFWCAGCIAMSFLSKDIWFNQKGEPQKKYYRLSDCSIKIFPIELDIDPYSGKPLKPITPQIVEEIESKKAGYVTLRVTSFPTDAEIYYNWIYKGNTPAIIKQESLKGNWIIVKDGYAPELKDKLDCNGADSLVLSLRPQQNNQQKKILIELQEGPLANKIYELMSYELEKRKFLLADANSLEVFKRAFNEAGGLENKAFRAWVSSKLHIAYILSMKAEYFVKDLGDERPVLKNTYSISVALRGQIIEVNSGQKITEISGRAETVSLNKEEGISDCALKAVKQSMRNFPEDIQ